MGSQLCKPSEIIEPPTITIETVQPKRWEPEPSSPTFLFSPSMSEPDGVEPDGIQVDENQVQVRVTCCNFPPIMRKGQSYRQAFMNSFRRSFTKRKETRQERKKKVTEC